MKKRKVLVSLLCATALLGVSAGTLTSCKKAEDPDNPSTEVQKYVVTFDSKGGSAVAKIENITSGNTIAKPTTDPTKKDFTFAGWYKDSNCTQEWKFDTDTVTGNVTLYAKWTATPVAKYTVTFDSKGGSAITKLENIESGSKIAKPTDPINEGYGLAGWYKTDPETDSNAVAWDFETDTVTSSVTLYAKWTKLEYELVTTECNIAALLEVYGNGNKITKEVEQGKFKFSPGLYFNTSTGNMTGPVVNNQQKKIYFTLSGVDNTNSIKFDAKGASKGLLKLYDSNDKEVHDYGEITSPQYNLKVDNLAAGTYYIVSEGSIRFGNISITEKLAKSAPVSITVSGAVNKDLQGREFSTAGLTVTLNYANGRQDVVASGYNVDSSAVNMAVAGKYTVDVSYTPDGATKPFTTSYEFVVCSIDSITLSDHSINSSRVTLPVQKVFALGSNLNTDHLAVRVVCSVPDSTEKEEFVLKSTEYKVSPIEDVNTAGKKTVTITVGNKTASYEVYYVDATNASKTSVIVDAAATEITKGQDGVFTVQTVNQAIQLLNILSPEVNDIKTITVKAGSYKEKVEITIPNIRLIGDGEKPEDTVLWCDILAGQTDPSGTSAYSTDGSASVSIRSTAEGFYAENITFKNYYNTHKLYEESKKLMSDTQAVACLVQADKSYFKNCRFTSYHDTLYAMSNRQLYENCYIEGRTDYIFGADATAYFKNCTISTIGTGDVKNGGYIVATKGTTGLLYGYIFDGCTLTTSGDAVDGTVSLARGWDVNMTLAFINCDISAAYSLTAYGTKTDGKNERYTNMNAKPVAAQLFEYGNKGLGALPADVISSANEKGIIENMCTYLKEAQVSQFRSFEVIFSKVQKRTEATDFTTSYADDWNGNAGVNITAKTYDFAIFTQNYTGVTIQDHFAKDFTITLPEAEKHALRWNGNSIQIDVGAKIVMKTPGKIYVSWFGGNYGNASNGIITYKDGCATLEIVNTPTTSGVYIVSIKIDLVDIPEDTVSYDVTLDLGYEGSPAATVVPVPGGNLMVEPETPTRDGYDFAGWYVGETEFNFNTAITEAITLTAHWTEILDLTIVEDTTFSFTGADAYQGTVSANETKKVGKMVVNGGTSGSFVKHDNSWYKLLGDATMTLSVKAGASIAVTTYDGNLVVNGTPVATADYVGSIGNMVYTYTATEDGDVVISKVTSANQAYISKVVVETTDVLLTKITEDTTYKYDGTLNNTENFALHNCAINGDWLKFDTNSRITFFVEAGATITISGSPYDGADAYLAIGTEELTKGSGDIWSYVAETAGRIDLVNSGVVYIKSIKVSYAVPEQDADILKAGQTISFGTAGNHGDCVASGKLVVVSGSIRDNGGDNSEISNATLSIKVKAGTVVMVSSYNGYTHYTVKKGDTLLTEAEVTATSWQYVATEDCTLTFVTTANNYFYSISALDSSSN